MKRWLIILLVPALTLTMAAAAGAEKEGKPSRPNIVLIMADDMGYECVSAYGAQDYQTPHLDRLAADGMRFNHCYAQPICTPSRVKIMTGRYNFRNYEDFGVLARSEVTFGNVMRDGGYTTGIVGKWQLGGDAATVRSFGFDRHCLWHLDGRQSRYWDPRLVRDGELLEKIEGAYGPEELAEYALNFIEEHQDEPFFLYYPMALPHWPFVPTPDSPPGGKRKRSGEYDGQAGGREYFPDMVSYVDKVVGQVAEKLRELGLEEKTLLMFTADNGTATNIRSRLNGRVVQGGKGLMTDAGTRVALVAHWPGTIRGGQVSDALVDFSDFLPTISEAGGVALPADRVIDGRSFLPVLLGEREEVRDWAFCHYHRNGLPTEVEDDVKRERLTERLKEEQEEKRMGQFARTQRYKLYADGRFYDVAADPLEEREISDEELTAEQRQVRSRLGKAHGQAPEWRVMHADGDRAGR